MLRLVGRSILIVEDEPLIALDVEQCLEAAGSNVLVTGQLEEALRLAERPGLSAAVIDFNLNGKRGSAVCSRLMERRVPFLFYSACHENELTPWPKAPILTKPASPDSIVAAMVCLLSCQPQGPAARRPEGQSWAELRAKAMLPPARYASRSARAASQAEARSAQLLAWSMWTSHPLRSNGAL